MRRRYALFLTTAIGVCQCFASEAEEDNSQFIKVKHSDKCIQVNDGSQDNGALITQWDCLDQDNILWTKVFVDGHHFMLQNKNSGQCAVVGPSWTGTPGVNGTPIVQGDCTKQDNTSWITKYAGPFLVYIVNDASGKCMHQEGGIGDNGGKISLWDCVDQDNVKFTITPHKPHNL
jgi:hypothetical protein